jgi:beta-aspartyl-peptidase (threonine type)
MSNIKKTYGIVVHGGAGGVIRNNYTQAEEKAQLDVLEQAIDAGYAILERGGNSKDAAIAAIKIFEDSPLYNAGKGSVFNADGKHELDASFMDGASLKGGGVGIVKTIKNPVLVARKVMEDCPHTLLAAEGAERYAKEHGFDMVENEYFSTKKRYEQYLQAKKKDDITLDHGDSIDCSQDDEMGSMGTVGAVVLDKNGNLVAATSTGGLTHKHPGRLGDSAVIGAGTYADNDTAAISCTGTGDIFLSIAAAKTMSDYLEDNNLCLSKAANAILEEVTQRGGRGGLIAITAKGESIEAFTTEGMFRAHRLSNGEKNIAMYGDHED